MPKLGPVRFHHRFEPPARPFCAYRKLCASARKPLLWGLLLQYPSEILSLPVWRRLLTLRQRTNRCQVSDHHDSQGLKGRKCGNQSMSRPEGDFRWWVGLAVVWGSPPLNQEGPRERGAFSNQESHRPATHQRMWVGKVLAGVWV